MKVYLKGLLFLNETIFPEGTVTDTLSRFNFTMMVSNAVLILPEISEYQFQNIDRGLYPIY